MDSAPAADLQKDALDQAAAKLGAPALGVYLYLQMKMVSLKKTAWFCWELREYLNIKEQSTLKKYLDAISQTEMAHIVFSPKGDSFLFQNWKAPRGPEKFGVEPEISVQGGKIPFTGDTESQPGEPKKSAQAGKIPPETENIGVEPKFSAQENTNKDFGVVGLNSTPTPSREELEEVQAVIQAAKDIPPGPSQVKFLLGEKIVEAALIYDTTISIPGHLWHAWHDSLRYDSHDLVKAIRRIKNAVLYCLQQKTIGLPIYNRIGYFFHAVKMARTPSRKKEKEEVIKKFDPDKSSPQEVQEEKEKYWRSRTFEELREHYLNLEKMNLIKPHSAPLEWFLAGVELTDFKNDVEAWIKTRSQKEA